MDVNVRHLLASIRSRVDHEPITAFESGLGRDFLGKPGGSDDTFRSLERRFVGEACQDIRRQLRNVIVVAVRREAARPGNASG